MTKQNYKAGPTSYNGSYRTPISRVITPVTHVFWAICVRVINSIYSRGPPSTAQWIHMKEVYQLIPQFATPTESISVVAWRLTTMVDFGWPVQQQWYTTRYNYHSEQSARILIHHTFFLAHQMATYGGSTCDEWVCQGTQDVEFHCWSLKSNNSPEAGTPPVGAFAHHHHVWKFMASQPAPPQVYKGLIAGLIKGNQWFYIYKPLIRPYFWGGC